MCITDLLLLSGIAIGQTSASTTVDLEDEKAVINELLDKFNEGFRKGEASLFLSYLADDALICGTDPSEFWSKEEYLGLYDQPSDANVPELTFMDDRVIHVAPDGKSAIVVSQFIIEWSPKIPWRNTYHFIKSDDGWKVFFVNIAFVPKNEHIGIINEAIKELPHTGFLNKGNLVGVHVVKVDLKPGVTMDQYIEFLNKKLKPAWEKADKGREVSLLKAIRGEHDKEFGMLVIYKDEAARNRHYNEDGSSSEYGNKINEKLAPVFAEGEKLGTWTSTYTDWIVL